MTIVAGCSLFDGVMLLADCRATITLRNGHELRVDHLQKVFPITATAAIGFAGDVPTAGELLKGLFGGALEEKARSCRLNSFNLSTWLPRHFRYMYRRLRGKPVAFMVASVVPGRANVIARSKAVALMERFRLGLLSHQRNWLPPILVNVLSTPPDDPDVALPDAPFGLVYSIETPDFKPRLIKPLEFAVIGSGRAAVDAIEYAADMLFAGDVGNSATESAAFRNAVAWFIRKNKIASVGGMYPCVKIDATGMHFCGHGVEIPVGGTRIQLGMNSNGRWFQRNLTTGKHITLKCPWEVNPTAFDANETFDDLDEEFDRLGI